jgi:hypothetical protein
LAFVLPSAALAAPSLPEDFEMPWEITEAGELTQHIPIVDSNMYDSEGRYQKAGKLGEGSVVELAAGETSGTLAFENPAGERFFVLDGGIYPVEDYYQPWMKIDVLGDGPFQVEPELEIYDWDSGLEILIYETSFEDNARNYLEWGQIDADCSIAGGYYDGWSWTDQRACNSEHSFKCTMYDEYKNMQEDYFYMKCCKLLDISMQYAVNVSFDIFVAGEWESWYVDTWGAELYTPLDYLVFGVEDCDKMVYAANGDMLFCDSAGYIMSGDYYFMDTSMPLFDSTGCAYDGYGYLECLKDYTPKARKSDECPGWWHVWFEIPVQALEGYPYYLDTEHFGIWFGWISDKERVYEGAYVDNVKIISIESEGEKIWQGHSQEWLILEDDYWFKFPLKWTTVEPGTYKLVVKIKNNDEDMYDMYEELIIEIGDLKDCEINVVELSDDFSGEPIPDGGTIQYGSDVHITFDYHNNGNVPQANIPIKATAYKLEKETLAFYDMESGFSYWYWPGNTEIYLSSDFAWSGQSSLAFNNPDNMHYDNDKFNAMMFGDPVNLEGVTEGYLDFYVLAKIGQYDELGIVLASEQGTYAWYGPRIAYGDAKIDPWMGPMQPQCSYQRYHLLDDLWGSIADYDKLDANGHMTYGMLFGFFLLSDSRDVFYMEEIDWSGAYFDDVKVTATVKGEAVWSDEMVLPGPCEPCESCVNQFVWEDVPYSCYIIEVCALNPGETDPSDNCKSVEFCVLENLEAMGKAEAEDLTACTPDSWCISNVVGNDCGNDGQGDIYALATNCDTHDVPAGVNDFVALDVGEDDCCPGAIDVRHLNFGGDTGASYNVLFSQPMVADPDTQASGPFSDDVFVFVLDNFAGVSGNIDAVQCIGLMYASDDSPIGDNWDVEFRTDAGGFPGSMYASENVAITEAGYVGSWLGWSLWDMTFELSSSVTGLSTGWLSLVLRSSGGERFAWIDSWAGDMYSEQHYWPSGYYGWNPYDVNFQLLELAGGGGGAGTCQYEICVDDTWGDTWNGGYLDIFVNGGYVMTVSAFDGAPGAMECYSFTVNNGDLIFLDYTYGSFPGENYWELLDSTGAVVWSSYGGYSDTAYDSYHDAVCPVGPEPDEILFNMTYQCDLYPGYAAVILEVAGSTAPSGGCGALQVVAYDSYGDGWDSNLDGNFDGRLDVYVNGAKKVEGLTVFGSVNDAAFLACNGDTITFEYVDGGGTWIGEHSFKLFGPGGNLIYTSPSPPDATADVEVPDVFDSCTDCPTVGCICPPGDDSYTQVATFTGNNPGVCNHFSIDLVPFLDDPVNVTHICIRLRLDTRASAGLPYAGPGIGFHVHEFSIGNVVYDPLTEEVSDFYEDFEDGNFVNEETGWEVCIGCITYGEFWEQVGPHEFCQYWPSEPIHNAIVWATEIADAYEAYLFGEWEASIPPGCTVYVELSADGGNNWFIINKQTGSFSTGKTKMPCMDPFDLTPWAGSHILIRVRVENTGGYSGFVCIDNFVILGKQDRIAPTASISLSGNSVGPGMYAGPVTVTITATDDTAMGEIHYILDGTENIVAGDSTTFTVGTDGSHTIEFWAVDKTGNEGQHQTVTFTIDNTPPTVAITAPEPGLYLFGNKLLDMSKAFIIGAFTIEATADDTQGIAFVKFFLNGEEIGADVTAPYSTYCAVKNMGAATIEAVAEDGVGNSADDSLDVTYYKFL